MNVKEMAATADKVSELMKLLSNKHRLMVLCQLVEGEKSSGSWPGSWACASRRCRSSSRRSAGRVDQARREGQTIYYALDRDDVRRLMTFLYETLLRRRRRL